MRVGKFKISKFVHLHFFNVWILMESKENLRLKDCLDFLILVKLGSHLGLNFTFLKWAGFVDIQIF